MAVQSTELVKQEPSQAITERSRWHSPEEVRARIEHVQKIYRTIMQKDTHFGTIPGTPKPTLYKAGSEILLSTFRISIEPTVEDVSDNPDEFRFRVRCTAYNEAGVSLGSGIGEASSNESKYKWRRAVCDEEFVEYQQQGRARRKWKKGERGGAYTEMQVRQDPADVANTVLKIAKKRAQIDVTLTVTACSDIFTQDVEDSEDSAGDSAGAQQHRDEFEDPRKTKAAPAEAYDQSFNPDDLVSFCKTHGQYKGDACPGCYPRETEQQQAPKPAQAKPISSPPPKEYQKITDGQAKRFFAIWNQNGLTRKEVAEFLKRRWNITNDHDIPAADYDEAIHFAEHGE